MSRTYGGGIIGGGVIFRHHARALSQVGERARLVGLADVDEYKLRQAGKDFFVPFTTTDYHELLARADVDLVCICTPPFLHEEMVTAALQAGKYVICEKPLAHNLAAADRIIETAKQFPGKLGVVYQQRYTPAARRTEWLRDQGTLGELQFGRFHRYGKLDPQQVSKGWWGKWDVAGGGAVITQCIHELDLLTHFLGRAKTVSAVMDTRGNDIESEDTFVATITTESGAILTGCSTLAGNIRPGVRWDVVGHQASTHYPWAVDCWDRGLRNQAARDAAAKFRDGRKPMLPGIAGKVVKRLKTKLGIGVRATPLEHTPYLRAVLDAMDTGQPIPLAPEEARASLELCTAIYESALRGTPVQLPLDSSCPYYNGVTAKDYDGRTRRNP